MLNPSVLFIIVCTLLSPNLSATTHSGYFLSAQAKDALVALRSIKHDGAIMSCSGTHVQSNDDRKYWILTAAHCVDDIASIWLSNQSYQVCFLTQDIVLRDPTGQDIALLSIDKRSCAWLANTSMLHLPQQSKPIERLKLFTSQKHHINSEDCIDNQACHYPRSTRRAVALSLEVIERTAVAWLNAGKQVCTGASGSPIISLQYPNQLLGIVSGVFESADRDIQSTEFVNGLYCADLIAYIRIDAQLDLDKYQRPMIDMEPTDQGLDLETTLSEANDYVDGQVRGTLKQAAVQVVIIAMIKSVVQSIVRTLVRTSIRAIIRTAVRSITKTIMQNIVKSTIKSIVKTLVRTLIRSVAKATSQLARQAAKGLRVLTRGFGRIATNLSKKMLKKFAREVGDQFVDEGISFAGISFASNQLITELTEE